jgi:hypothetical protein
MSLEQCVRYGDRIKGEGGLIKSGNDSFMRMREGNEYKELRRRSVSRGSNSRTKNREP